MGKLQTYALAITLLLCPALPGFSQNSASAGMPVLHETQPAISTQVANYAKSFLGTPYRLGASGPRAFDCSSYTSYVFKHFGYDIPAYSKTQFHKGRPVQRYADLQVGDLVFFGKRAGARDIGHVGILVEKNEESGSFSFIHASVSKGVVIESSNHPYFQLRYIGARRILPDE